MRKNQTPLGADKVGVGVAAPVKKSHKGQRTARPKSLLRMDSKTTSTFRHSVQETLL